MNKRLTVDQLENMKVHELADLLGNIVLVLKRMPNVEFRQLTTQFSLEDSVIEKENSVQPPAPTLTDANLALKEAELKSKKKAELEVIAADLGLKLPKKITKDEYVAKIFARLSQSHSEQYAIQNL
jgi:hypothetical protein